MDDRWDGHLPGPIHCKVCKKELSSSKGPNPAETYAGTYTGLCYGCEKAAPYLSSREPLDSAEWWSHPPSYPSHRRDRESHIYYPDCPKKCEYGKTVATYYGKTCESCHDRYFHNTFRKWESARRLRIYQAANNAFLKYLVKIKMCKKVKKKIEPLPRDEKEYQQVVERFLARHKKAMDRHEELCKKKMDRLIRA